MLQERLLGQVGALFSRAAGPTTRVAVEHELLVADATTGAAVPIDRVRAAVRDTAGRDHVSFEPGGQLELSLPCVPGPRALERQVRAELAAVRSACGAAGIRLVAAPTDRRPEADVPLQVRSTRYVAMQRHFDAIGPAGRRMMRRTASTQVCLDWWPGRAGMEQWQLLHLAGPFLAAAVARESGPGSRLDTWLAVDPSRTAFDGRLVSGEDPVAAYADFAVGAAVLGRPGDVRQHLSTLFPPVRPRGRYLEVRFPDAQPDHAIAPLAAALVALVHDDDIRTSVLDRVRGEGSRLAQHWRDAADGDAEVTARGRELLELAGARQEVGAA